MGLGLVVAAFAGLALAMVLAVTTAGIMLASRMTGRLQPAVARPTKSRTGQADKQHGYRVWNDGRGTIIDM
ncbi:hypothetical protein AWJ14_14250 [Hoeflea olei]|uniref:Uncharacterized protein n=2 Tax=Hoeflea olei TaxID=1480615 RepID=A0A1C1YVD0_9HYPH|nr:hypothetical protein AWJ14_14250 [Hoeflea olei]